MIKFFIKILKLPIYLYRYLLSPWIGNSCRFTPTCSQYMLDALDTHGAVKGLYLGAKRICRCNPFCKGGHDPIPPKK